MTRTFDDYKIDLMVELTNRITRNVNGLLKRIASGDDPDSIGQHSEDIKSALNLLVSIGCSDSPAHRRD